MWQLGEELLAEEFLPDAALLEDLKQRLNILLRR